MQNIGRTLSKLSDGRNDAPNYPRWPRDSGLQGGGLGRDDDPLECVGKKYPTVALSGAHRSRTYRAPPRAIRRAPASAGSAQSALTKGCPGADRGPGRRGLDRGLGEPVSRRRGLWGPLGGGPPQGRCPAGPASDRCQGVEVAACTRRAVSTSAAAARPARLHSSSVAAVWL